MVEIETSGLRDYAYSVIYLPALVRTAVRVGDPELGARLAHGLGGISTYAEHSLVAVGAILAEARGDLETATATYADAADRWERFGVVTEQGFALLGLGRSLLGLARRAEAEPALRHARTIFERLGAAPALAETDALLRAALER